MDNRLTPSTLKADVISQLNALKKTIQQEEEQRHLLQIELKKQQTRFINAKKQLDYQITENNELKRTIFNNTHDEKRTRMELRQQLQSSMIIRFFYFFGITWGKTRRLQTLATALSNQLQWDNWQFSENQQRIHAQEEHTTHLKNTIVNWSRSLEQIDKHIQSLKHQKHQLITDPENQLTPEQDGMIVTRTEVHTTQWRLLNSAYQYAASFINYRRHEETSTSSRPVSTEAKNAETVTHALEPAKTSQTLG